MVLVGELFDCFYGGFLGRNVWGEGRVEAVGHDWVVLRMESGPYFASFESHTQMLSIIDGWRHETAQRKRNE